jgi:hypothetical protein
MRTARVAIVVIGTLAASACMTAPSPSERAVDWEPSRIAVAPAGGLSPTLHPGRGRPPLGKFSLRFYQKLKSHAGVAPLAEVDLWELRHHPMQYDIITIGPVALRQWTGRKELLDHLAATHGLTPEKRQVLLNWVQTGGVVWAEFGIFVQGHEWIRGDQRTLPALPDLAGFTIFGLPTRARVFEARRTAPFTIEPRVFSFQNAAPHVATSDIKSLTLTQVDLRTVYPIVDAPAAEPLVQEAGQTYATVAALGQGKLISSLPFDQWNSETDGEKYRINLLEWLAGHPIPAFDPALDIERGRD